MGGGLKGGGTPIGRGGSGIPLGSIGGGGSGFPSGPIIIPPGGIGRYPGGIIVGIPIEMDG